MVGRERNVVKHLSEDKLNRLQAEADEIKEYKRLTFFKRLCDGATPAAAAEDIGISHGTTSNWMTRWNEGGLGKLTLNSGATGPRSSMKPNNSNFLNASAKPNRGKNKRYNISLTRMLTMVHITSAKMTNPTRTRTTACILRIGRIKTCTNSSYSRTTTTPPSATSR